VNPESQVTPFKLRTTRVFDSEIRSRDSLFARFSTREEDRDYRFVCLAKKKFRVSAKIRIFENVYSRETRENYVEVYSSKVFFFLFFFQHTIILRITRLGTRKK